MNYFIIGDVHGCYYTFKSMLETYWDKENEIVIQLGDLIDRGKNSPQMVEYARDLHTEFPDQVLFLKGNHEFEIIEHFFTEPNKNWLRQCGEETLKQYKAANRDCLDDVRWLKERPLFYESENVFVSHAGISKATEDPFNEDNAYGILWNRSPLKNIGKLQIIGHTPCDDPQYDKESNSWNIDTAAAYSGYLTGVKIKTNGEIIELNKGITDPRDK